MLDETLQEKYDALLTALAKFGNVAVAFSGGVDSTLLLKAAQQALGANVLALIGRSPAKPQRETDAAVQFAKDEGIRHIVVDTREFDVDGFDHNPENRCYLCKREMFTQFIATATRLGFKHLVEGSNADDSTDWRPGEKALSELHVASPLRDAGLVKQEIRDISRELGLATWNKPSYSCLLSRFEYDELLSDEKLERVDAAEVALMELGFSQVRVRVKGDDARIELEPADIERAAQSDMRTAIVEALHAQGFVHISLDLTGYRFGSMDEGRASGLPEARP